MHYFKYAILLSMIIISGCNDKLSDKNSERVLYNSSGGKLNTLDPILASDLVSRDMVAEFYDTLVQYDYVARPYELRPSMLSEMPIINETITTYTFSLRDDLFFVDDECFTQKIPAERKITSQDIIFSLLRLADARNHSPGYWTIRGKIKGVDTFREKSLTYKPGDFSLYDTKIEGFEIISPTKFSIHLTKPDPRLLYMLAMPYASVVSRTAAEYYGSQFMEHPVGSGPFKLSKWRRSHSIELVRNKTYREEYFAHAATPSDRTQRLPLVDRVTCYLVDQPLSSWLMFLKGEMDLSSLDKDNFDAVVTKDLKLIPVLAQRDIQMIQLPEFQINYIGFCFSDPVVGKNLNLRKAISLAYDVGLRVKHFNYRLVPAHGPIPPGVPGYDPKTLNTYSELNIEQAKKYLTAAGYPDGIDPATGQALELSFDLGSTSSQSRQLAELFANDMKKIGILIKPSLNNKSRFKQKLRKGDMQIFKYSWVGDYPDAENFLQLFYGPNAGGCNRASYRNEVFDKMYEPIISMQDSPQRTVQYKEMSKYLATQCPWIFESFPISYRLTHSWLENYIPHDFAFSRWKYLSINTSKRTAEKKGFTPLSMQDLRND